MTRSMICPLCGNEGSKAVPFMDPESNKIICRETDYHWRCCTQCGNAFPSQEPTLPELQAFWDRNRVELPASSDPEVIWQRRYRESWVWANRTWDFVSPFLQPGMKRFLDIACGLGTTVKLFQDKGWQAEGIDADPSTRVYHEKAGIRCMIGQVEQFKYEERYDVICIAHAIYFMTDPLGFVRRIKGMLQPGGMFIVVLSNLLSSGSEGSPLYAHTWFSTGESLAYTLEQEGFRILKSERIGGSTLVLATPVKLGDAPAQRTSVNFLKIYLLHRTHELRYALYGRPRRWLADKVKKVLISLRLYG